MLVAPILFVAAHGHTLDSIEGYRMEIAWENNPPYSEEINAIMLYVSPLVPGLELEEQPFQNGVTGLEDTLRMQLVARGYTTTLFLDPDKDIPGKYRAFVKVLRPGYYQANILGHIGDTTISFSMHPPQIRNADLITFPADYGPVHEISAELDRLEGGLGNMTATYRDDLDSLRSSYEAELDQLRNRVDALERPADQTISYAGVGLGIAAVSLAVLALVRSRAVS